MQRLPLPEGCPPFLAGLIYDCWSEDPAQRPGFPSIRERLLGELARVAADTAQQAHRVECRSTVSETDASSAAAGPSLGGFGSSCGGGSRGSGEVRNSSKGSAGGSSTGQQLPAPQTAAQQLESPFAAIGAFFSSSTSGSSSGGSSRGSDAADAAKGGM